MELIQKIVQKMVRTELNIGIAAWLDKRSLVAWLYLLEHACVISSIKMFDHGTIVNIAKN